jgi:hypothetical protein
LKGKSSSGKPEVSIGVSGGPGTGGPYRGVVLFQLGERTEVLERRQSDTLAELTAALTARARAAGGLENDDAVEGAVALNGASLALYRLEMPAVKGSQLTSIIRMQVEAKLPISADQIRMAWRSNGTVGSAQEYMVVAGRASRYDETILAGRNAGLTAAVTDWEAAARAWGLGGMPAGRKVALVVKPTHTAALLMENGRLLDAVNLDAGQEEFARSPEDEKLQLFTHDLWNTLARFGTAASPEVTVAAKVNGAAAAALLKGVGITVKEGWPDAAAGEDGPEYLEAIGAAALALDPANQRLDLMTSHPNLQPIRKPLVTITTAVALAAVILAAAIFLVAARKLDEAALAKLQDNRIEQLVRVQTLRKQIAEQRPDMLDLLTKINDSLQAGMLLESFTFQKGKPVTISSYATTLDQAFKFEEELKKKPGVTEVKMQDRTFDERRNRYNFKVTLSYLNFSKTIK